MLPQIQPHPGPDWVLDFVCLTGLNIHTIPIGVGLAGMYGQRRDNSSASAFANSSALLQRHHNSETSNRASLQTRWHHLIGEQTHMREDSLLCSRGCFHPNVQLSGSCLHAERVQKSKKLIHTRWPKDSHAAECQGKNGKKRIRSELTIPGGHAHRVQHDVQFLSVAR